jgi:catechol 2,3-dioxygenase-like lactoylglutathione lyase family enzyme
MPPMSVDRVSDLVPFVHVADPERSIDFYEQFGFEVVNSLRHHDQLDWAFLHASEGRLMVARATEPIDPGEQAVLFYLYVRDLPALRNRLLQAGIDAGEISHDGAIPAGEMRVGDPDGYVLIVAQSEEGTARSAIF